jgi:hypothetical protein
MGVIVRVRCPHSFVVDSACPCPHSYTFCLFLIHAARVLSKRWSSCSLEVYYITFLSTTFLPQY